MLFSVVGSFLVALKWEMQKKWQQYNFMTQQPHQVFKGVRQEGTC
jgi:hypothetical protein